MATRAARIEELDLISMLSICDETVCGLILSCLAIAALGTPAASPISASANPMRPLTSLNIDRALPNNLIASAMLLSSFANSYEGSEWSGQSCGQVRSSRRPSTVGSH